MARQARKDSGETSTWSGTAKQPGMDGRTPHTSLLRRWNSRLTRLLAALGVATSWLFGSISACTYACMCTLHRWVHTRPVNTAGKCHCTKPVLDTGCKTCSACFPHHSSILCNLRNQFCRPVNLPSPKQLVNYIQLVIPVTLTKISYHVQKSIHQKCQHISEQGSTVLAKLVSPHLSVAA